jgi:hypothetical protein
MIYDPEVTYEDLAAASWKVVKNGYAPAKTVDFVYKAAPQE